MTTEANSLAELRIGLVACPAAEAALAGCLRQAQASFAHIDADAVDPGAEELDRYHALILHVGDTAIESNWFRPKLLRSNSRPLLLAAEPEAIFARASLRDHADDIIFAPYLASELTFRLSRIIGGAPDEPRAAARSSKLCVLAADDDPDIITFLKCVLQRFDVDAHFVTDGLAALAAARKLLPDLLLLDIDLPIMSGIDVLSRLRNDPGTCALTTLLLTASADSMHVQKGVGLGAVDYVLKPVGYFDLVRKLKPLLRAQEPAQH